MDLLIKPSDLRYKYRRPPQEERESKRVPAIDATPLNRDDLYEVLAVLTAAMTSLNTRDGTLLNWLEERMLEMPRFISSRAEAVRYLHESALEYLDP